MPVGGLVRHGWHDCSEVAGVGVTGVLADKVMEAMSGQQEATASLASHGGGGYQAGACG